MAFRQDVNNRGLSATRMSTQCANVPQQSTNVGAFQTET